MNLKYLNLADCDNIDDENIQNLLKFLDLQQHSYNYCKNILINFKYTHFSNYIIDDKYLSVYMPYDSNEA